MSKDQNFVLKEQLLGEIWDEISSLNGHALDEYLTDIGLSPDVLLQDYAKGIDAARIASKRARFEEAAGRFGFWQARMTPKSLRSICLRRGRSLPL